MDRKEIPKPLIDTADMTTAGQASLSLRDFQTRLSALHRISRAIGSALDLDTLLVRVMRELCKILDAQRSTLFLIDQSTAEVWSKVLLTGDNLREIRLPLGEGLAGWAAASGRPLSVRNAYEDPRFDDAFDRTSGFRTEAVLCCPVTDSKGETIGVIECLNKGEGGAFSLADMVMVQTIQPTIGIAIENARLYQSMMRQNEVLRRTQSALRNRVGELDVLYGLERVLGTRESSQRRLVEDLLAEALVSFAAKAVAIVVDGERVTEAYLASSANEGEVTALFDVPLDGVIGSVLRSRASVAGIVAELDDTVGTTLQDYAAAEDALVAVPLTFPSFDEDAADCPAALVLVLEARLDDPEAEGLSPQLRLLDLVAAQTSRGLRALAEQQRRQQSARLTAAGRMLAGVIADMQTPMSSIRISAEAIQEAAADAQQAGLAATILGQVRHLGDMVSEVHAFTRGEHTVLKRQVSIPTFIDEVSGHIREDLNASGIALRTKVGYLDRASLDPVKMTRAILNLVRNTREAMGDREDPYFEVAVHGRGETLTMDFSDNGPGIPGDVLNHVFESFHPAGLGAGGMGLALVREIVEAHQGTIDIQTELGIGTRISFRLPLTTNAR